MELSNLNGDDPRTAYLFAVARLANAAYTAEAVGKFVGVVQLVTSSEPTLLVVSDDSEQLTTPDEVIDHIYSLGGYASKEGIEFHLRRDAAILRKM
jgi:hypothetical protein